eukprot:scaffold1540_cov194-Alexandrium_tamarense.AAC.10
MVVALVLLLLVLRAVGGELCWFGGSYDGNFAHGWLQPTKSLPVRLSYKMLWKEIKEKTIK